MFLLGVPHTRETGGKFWFKPFLVNSVKLSPDSCFFVACLTGVWYALDSQSFSNMGVRKAIPLFRRLTCLLTLLDTSFHVTSFNAGNDIGW